jgi:hypothetical protein
MYISAVVVGPVDWGQKGISAGQAALAFPRIPQGSKAQEPIITRRILGLWITVDFSHTLKLVVPLTQQVFHRLRNHPSIQG